MGPTSYMQSVINRDVIIQHIPVIVALPGCDHWLKHVTVNVINEYTVTYNVVLIRKSINKH
jgi:hypothetical protein